MPVRGQTDSFDTGQIVLGFITATVVLIRLGFKLFVTRKPLTADDYIFIALAMVAAPSVAITHYGTVPNGLGRDIWALPPQSITDFLFYFYLIMILYFTSVTLVKLCLLFFYLRIFPSQRVRHLLCGTVVFTGMFGVTFFFLVVFQCSPVRHFWQQWDGEHEGTCLDLSTIAWANSAFSIALDFWMLAIPLAQLKNLTLEWKKKVGVGLMFFVGTLYADVSPAPRFPFCSYLTDRFPTQRDRCLDYPCSGPDFAQNVGQRNIGQLLRLSVVDDRAERRHHLHLHADTSPTSGAALPQASRR